MVQLHGCGFTRFRVLSSLYGRGPRRNSLISEGQGCPETSKLHLYFRLIQRIKDVGGMQMLELHGLACGQNKLKKHDNIIITLSHYFIILLSYHSIALSSYWHWDMTFVWFSHDFAAYRPQDRWISSKIQRRSSVWSPLYPLKIFENNCPKHLFCTKIENSQSNPKVSECIWTHSDASEFAECIWSGQKMSEQVWELGKACKELGNHGQH